MKLLFTVIISIWILGFPSCANSQEIKTAPQQDTLILSKPDTLKLIFIGDIMGHDEQILAAYNDSSKTYDYSHTFEKISPLLKKVDFTIANLEVTLACPPYTGYPQFSSPKELPMAAHQYGITHFVTANNHAADRLEKGVLRTVNVLDSLGIPFTGTFKDSLDRNTRNLMILQKGNIKIGMLNYTYGTNGITIKPPCLINYIDTIQILNDIQASKTKKLDKLVVFLHWGTEYVANPVKSQTDLAHFLFKNGVDIIIGSHPHVLEPMIFDYDSTLKKERFIAYSLGNFVSNQRTAPRDGGAMVEIQLVKQNHQTTIDSVGYHLTWVNKPIINKKTTFQVLPCAYYETNEANLMDASLHDKMMVYINYARKLLGEENKSVPEIVPSIKH